MLAIVHQPDAGPGVFADALSSRGVELDQWLPAMEVAPPDDLAGYAALLTFGGAMHADQEEAHPWLRVEKELLSDALARGTPILAVCLGAQLLAEAAGARPRRARQPEIGWLEVAVDAEGAADPLLGPLAPSFHAFQWHSYEFPLPSGAVALAHSPVCLQACRIGERAWAVQFHAEVAGADAEAWIDDYRSDEDAVRTGADPDVLRRETRREIARWNELGRGICERFVEAATRE
jgi:GMP synthase (glutamine-hydrolysing)